MVFKKVKTNKSEYASPEKLFGDLSGRKIPALFVQQADVLRSYAKLPNAERDVALQMPTGSGKTLVGLLIGEWRRRTLRERVLYLCPTRQLVNQVVEQADRYGIPAMGLAGSQKEFTPQQRLAYSSGTHVCAATYSGLFNTNPFFKDPGSLILDDAHAAENYVASYWTLGITRKHHPELFAACLDVLDPVLTATDRARLRKADPDSWDTSYVDKIASPLLDPIVVDLRAAIDALVGDTNLKYQWSVLADHLAACNVYVSYSEICIRPLLPPTARHSPFANAAQRVYLSATLGEGGELERLWGRRRITRLPPPVNFEGKMVGRRFFLIPECSVDPDKAVEFARNAIAQVDRALVLAPSNVDADSWAEVLDGLGAKIVRARELEASKESFVASRNAVAIVANRYDGIDLAEDECRLLVISGLPRATNLQERFLVERMSAQTLLADRIQTRVTQAFGRCTRSTTDYAAVVVVGPELSTYLVQPENREVMSPELQAELHFGMEQSTDVSLPEMKELLDEFLAQTAVWRDAELDIVALRDAVEVSPLEGLEALSSIAAKEVDYQQYLWGGDLVSALRVAREVVGELGGDHLRGYRAFWYYLAGSAAYRVARETNGSMDTALELFSCAAKAVSLRWLPRLQALCAGEEPSVSVDPLPRILVERLDHQLAGYGKASAKKLDREIAAIRKGLSSSSAKAFEDAHRRLGQLLGYESGNTEENAGPDPWWICGGEVALVFEDHDPGNPSSLGAQKVRQAASHPKWIRAKKVVPEGCRVIPVLLTSCEQLDDGAAIHGEEVLYWRLEDFRAWANQALSTIRALWAKYPGSGDLAWRAEAAMQLSSNDVAPTQLFTLLRPLAELGG